MYVHVCMKKVSIIVEVHVCVKISDHFSVCLFLQRQQPKPQHKFELAQSNFPPLPTSSDGSSLSTAHPTVTQSQSHMTSGIDDCGGNRPTVSDIVRGKHLKESQPSSTSSSLSATVVPTTSSHQHTLNSPNILAPPSVTTAVNPTTSSTPSSAATPLSTSVTSTSTTVAEKRPPPTQAATPTTPVSTVSSAVTHSQHSQTQPTTSQSQSQQVNSSQISQQPNSSAATGSTTTFTSITSSSSTNVSSSNSGVNSVSGTSGASISTPAAQTVPTVVTASQVVSSGNQSLTTKPSQVSQAPPLPLPLSTTTTTTSMTSAASTPSSTGPSSTAPISTPSGPVSQSTPTVVSRHQPQTLAQTASQVVAMGIPAAAPATSTSPTTATSTAGGGAVGVILANQSHQTASSRQAPPQPKAQRPDSKVGQKKIHVYHP